MLLAVALAPTLAVLATYLLSRRRVGAVERLADRNGTKLAEIHVLVNSRLTEALERINDLEKSLRLEPGEPVPPPKDEVVEL